MTVRRPEIEEQHLASVLEELLVYLKRDNGQKDKIPLIDPTANVKDALAAAVTRLDDIRSVDSSHVKEIREIQEKHQIELTALRNELLTKESQRLDAVNSAERSRVDSQFLNTANALALANEKQSTAATALAQSVITSAEVLRAAAAAQTATFTAAIRTLEQNQFQNTGRDVQRTENRTQSNWTIERVLAIVFFLATLAMAIIAALKP